MKIIMLGDIVGKAGRKALETYLPDLRAHYTPDLVIVNGENAAHRVGITPKIADQFFELGVNGITGGDHSFDRPEIIEYMADQPCLIRPMNMPAGTPGQGVMSLKTDSGYCLVVNLLGRVFMNPVDDPFAALEGVLQATSLQSPDIAAIIVDFHGEATSETIAMARHFDGRISALVGTHTHIPTADGAVLSGGTALQCDLGMCGDYQSVIGTDAVEPIYRFTHGRPNGRFEPAEGPASLAGCYLDIDDQTGKTKNYEAIRVGPYFASQAPACFSK